MYVRSTKVILQEYGSYKTYTLLAYLIIYVRIHIHNVHTYVHIMCMHTL